MTDPHATDALVDLLAPGHLWGPHGVRHTIQRWYDEHVAPDLKVLNRMLRDYMPIAEANSDIVAQRKGREQAEAKLAAARALLAQARVPRCTGNCSQQHGAPSWDGHNWDCAAGLWLTAREALGMGDDE